MSVDLGSAPHQESWRASGYVRRRILVLLAAAVVVLGIAAFSLSFDALKDLAVASGIERRLAWIWPLVVDGFICVATVAAVLLRPRGWRIAWYPWVTLTLAACVSVAGNALHAASHADLSRVSLVVAALVSAVPPAALLCASHMLVVLLAPSGRTRRDVASDARTDVPAESWPSAFENGGASRWSPSETGWSDGGSVTSSQDERVRESRGRVGQLTARPTNVELHVWMRKELSAGHGVTGAMVAERYGVSASTGRRWLQALRTEGTPAAQVVSGPGGDDVLAGGLRARTNGTHEQAVS